MRARGGDDLPQEDGGARPAAGRCSPGAPPRPMHACMQHACNMPCAELRCPSSVLPWQFCTCNTSSVIKQVAGGRGDGAMDILDRLAGSSASCDMPNKACIRQGRRARGRRRWRWAWRRSWARRCPSARWWAARCTRPRSRRPRSSWSTSGAPLVRPHFTHICNIFKHFVSHIVFDDICPSLILISWNSTDIVAVDWLYHCRSE